MKDVEFIKIPFSEINNHLTLLDEDWGSCPNWIYIDLIHRVTDGYMMSWCDTLDHFMKDLSEALYDRANKKRFYVSVEADCADDKEYYVGDKILKNAHRVWVVEGYADNPGYFYDHIYEYKLNAYEYNK